MKLMTLLFFLISSGTYAQSTGPVYNFNFYNKDVNTAGGVPTTTPTPTAPGTTAAASGLSAQEVKTNEAKVSKNYFSRSLLNPEDNYIGLVFTYIQPVKKEDNEVKHSSFSANFVLPSLWGIKYIHQSLTNLGTDYDGYQADAYDLSSNKFGINKFIPIANNLAFEVGGYYESGKIQDNGTYSPGSMEYSYDEMPFQAGSGSIGLVAFTGNLTLGIQYEKRFAFKSDIVNWSIEDKVKNQGTLAANIGLVF